MGRVPLFEVHVFVFLKVAKYLGKYWKPRTCDRPGVQEWLVTDYLRSASAGGDVAA